MVNPVVLAIIESVNEMKLWKYKFIRLVAACITFTLAVGPIAASAEIVMQCRQMQGAAPLACADMQMPATAAVRSLPHLLPCCRHHAVDTYALATRGNALTQSVRGSCIIITNTAAEAIGQSVIPPRVEAVVSTSTVALPHALACPVLTTERHTNRILDHTIALVHNQTARIHGTRAPPSS